MSVLFTTNDVGKASEIRDFDVFGEPVAVPSWTATTSEAFTGHRRDLDIGLVDAGARLYDTNFGVFVSADPLRVSGPGSQAFNPYAYANNDPVNLFDPTGLQAEGNPAQPEVDGDGAPVPGVWYCGSNGTGSTCICAPPGCGPDEDLRYRQDRDTPISEFLTNSGNAAGAGQPVDAGQWYRDLQQEFIDMPQDPDSVTGYEIMKMRMLIGVVEGIPVIGAPFLAATAADSEAPVGSRILAGVGTVTSLLPLVGVVKGALAAGGAPSAYSVAFEATLTERGVGTYAAHFAEANEQLLKATATPELAAALRESLGANFEGTIVSQSGRVLGSSPAGWTWHHVADRPGVLQLVPGGQHAPGSAYQGLLHPGGEGGMAIWGWRF
jgi:RHS repeat-associated protein